MFNNITYDYLFNIDHSKYRESGFKIEYSYKNVFDSLIDPIINIQNSVINKITASKMVPNILTTLGVISRTFSIYFLIWDDNRYKRYLSSLFFILGYYFDCSDGHYARKYDMCTNFGCFYDHFSDIVSTIILMIVCIFKKMFVSLFLFTLFSFFSINQLLVQEEIFSNYTPFFNFLKNNFEFLKVFDSLDFVKYFGMTSWVVLIGLSIIFEKSPS